MDNEEYEEYILDVPFTVEVEKAIKHLKRRKAPGPDSLLAEHLIEGGQSVICLTSILNAIIDLEAIPDSFKSGLVVPVSLNSDGRTCTHSGRGQLQLGIGSLTVPQELWVADIHDECILGLVSYGLTTVRSTSRMDL